MNSLICRHGASGAVVRGSQIRVVLVLSLALRTNVPSPLLVMGAIVVLHSFNGERLGRICRGRLLAKLLGVRNDLRLVTLLAALRLALAFAAVAAASLLVGLSQFVNNLALFLEFRLESDDRIITSGWGYLSLL